MRTRGVKERKVLESGSSHAGAAWCGPRSKACGCRDRCRGRGRPATVPPPPPPLLYVLADDANRVLKVCDPAPASGYMCATCITLVTRCTLLCAMPHAHHFSARCDSQCRRGHTCRGSLTPLPPRRMDDCGAALRMSHGACPHSCITPAGVTAGRRGRLPAAVPGSPTHVPCAQVSPRAARHRQPLWRSRVTRTQGRGSL